jgi:hypothetical protein
MTKEENAYADALNEYGSDTEDQSEHDILLSLHARSMAGLPESIKVHTTNFAAVLAAVAARGPRCDDCGEFTFRQHLSNKIFKSKPKLCHGCAEKIVGNKATGPFGIGYNLKGGW